MQYKFMQTDTVTYIYFLERSKNYIFVSVKIIRLIIYFLISIIE